VIEVRRDGGADALISASSHPTTVRALARMFDYSVEISAVIERVMGHEVAGNDEINVLAVLAVAESATIAELLRLTSLPRARLGRAVDELESAGLVAREVSTDDRRMRNVVLVDEGRRRLSHVDHELRLWFREHADDATRIVGLLAPQLSGPTHPPPSDALAVVGQMGVAGGAWVHSMRLAGAPSQPRQRMVLAMLASSGQLRPRQLADRLDMTSGGVTYLVDQMAGAGLVERAYGVLGDDRRAVVIRLTAAGRAGVEAMMAALDTHAGSLAAALVASLDLC
jgi:DNA-binding MarR family transcriptional regulator